MKKKLVACLLVAAMTVGLTACGSSSSSSTKKGSDGSDAGKLGEYEEKEIDGITYHKATDMTTDNIELTYYTFDDEATVKALKERFEEIYDNIKVKIVPGGDDFQATLLTLVQNGEAPDVFMYTDCEFALSNMLLLDISEYYNNDPETKEVASTINDDGIGCFGTEGRYAVPVKFYPGIMFVDRNCLKKLNLSVPTQQWTWDEMIQLIKDATQKDSEMDYYGLGFFNRLDSYYGIASSQNIVGEFGFNGTTFDLSAWAVGEQEFAELKQSGYVAPSQASAEMETWAGDWDFWCGSTGHVAVFSEAFWTFQNIWNTDNYKENFDLDIVPYCIPAVSAEDASAEHHSIANIDFGGVSSGTQYPREAYELLKFMSFGRDGWLTRCQLYKSGQMAADGVTPLKNSQMPAPITTNEEVWDAYIDMYCDGMDEEHTQLWKDYFATCMQPIPFGWVNIAGYWNYCDGYFNNIDIHKKVDTGTAKAADYVDEGTKQANSYHARAMIEYFGPSGYDVLSDEDIQLYNDMIIDTAN